MAPKKTKILIVEDAIQNATLLQRLVQRTMGYEADVVYTGKDALDYLAREHVDLVLLDIVMPVMNGLTVLKRIREQHDKQQLPVIVLSARSNNRDITASLMNGANDFVSKPLTLSILRVRIENQLELKQLHDQHQLATKALRHASVTKSRLMRIASHDLKNPLHGISLILSLLDPLVADDPRAGELLTSAVRYAERMEMLIEEFLEMNILQDNAIQVSLETVLIGGVVREVLQDYSHAAMWKNIIFDVDVNPELRVLADQNRLKQVVANLVSNAVKYSPPQTTVRLEAHTDDDDLTLHIIDEGAGIPPDEVDQLFQPFGKLSTKPTGLEHSTGLGLWIVKEMMVLQNGEAGVNTAYQDGADFWIRLPMVPLLTEACEAS